MRHYLLNERDIGRRLRANVVLAETANQLYRDTTYQDLITFEEDIAKISAMVLVIAESAGSLAELGAFASNDTIRKSLAIVMQEKYADAESFIRYGPVERVKKEDSERVAFFPWRENSKRKIVKVSARPHVQGVVKFLNGILKKIPNTTLFSKSTEIREFIILYWVIHLSLAIPIGKLTLYVENIIRDVDERKVRKYLYCMQLAGWIDIKHYSNTDYYYCLYDIDPIKYKFRAEVVEKESIRRKTNVVEVIQRDLALPRHVKTVAAEKRLAG